MYMYGMAPGAEGRMQPDLSICIDLQQVRIKTATGNLPDTLEV
jgi:hypothetical protein